MKMISTSGHVVALLCGLSGNDGLSNDVRAMCREATEVVADMENELAGLQPLPRALLVDTEGGADR